MQGPIPGLIQSAMKKIHTLNLQDLGIYQTPNYALTVSSVQRVINKREVCVQNQSLKSDILKVDLLDVHDSMLTCL